jgi:hypothetical protein
VNVVIVKKSDWSVRIGHSTDLLAPLDPYACHIATLAAG